MSELTGARDEGVEVLEGPELGVDRVVAAVLAADRPRRAGVVRARGQGVVGALAVDLADRVDRRQVEDVEAHLGHPVEALGRRPEGAAGDLAGLRVARRALRAREELVPAAEERARAVGAEPERPRDGEQLAQRVGEEHGLELGVLEGGEARADGTLGVGRSRDRAGDDGGRPLVERVLARPCGHPLQQEPRLGEHELHVDPGRDLDARVVLPGRDRVGPRVDLEGPLALDVGRHVGDVAVGRLAVGSHPHGVAGPAARIRGDHLRGELVVALAEDRSAYGQRLPDGGLGRLATQVDHGRDIHHGYPSNHGPTLANPNPARKPTAAGATPWDVPTAVDPVRPARRRRSSVVRLRRG